MTEDEMVGWHHQFSGQKFEWAPEVGDGQGGLVCCSPWNRSWDTTEMGSERASPLCPVTEPGRRAWAGLPLKDPKSMRPALLSASHFYTCPAKVVATRQLGTLRLRAAA